MPRRRNQQWRGREHHPPYCTCDECQRRRLSKWRRGATQPDRGSSARRAGPSTRQARHNRSPGSGNTHRYPRRGPGFWQRVRWLAVRLVVLSVLVTAALIGYHAYSGAPLGPAIDMTTEDYRVAAACPTDPGTVFDFVGRPPYPDSRSNMSIRYSEGWEAQVCNGVLAYELPAEAGEGERPVQAVATVTEESGPVIIATATTDGHSN